MLIHLDSKIDTVNQIETVNHDLVFKLPYIPFGLDDFEIKIVQLLIVWNQPVLPLYGFLTSTIIDKSVLNPTQQLLAFSQSKKNNYLLYTPMHPERYIIQRQNFETADFHLELSEKHKIKRIKLILEISNVNRYQ